MPAHAPAAVAAFLRCGNLHAGFTRLRCPDCHHEYLLAFTCKQRGLCAPADDFIQADASDDSGQ